MERTLWAFWSGLVDCRGDLDCVLDRIGRRATELVGEGAVLGLVSTDGSLLEPVAVHHPDEEMAAYMRAVLASGSTPVGVGMAGTVARDRAPMQVAGLDPDDLAPLVAPVFREFHRRHPMRAVLIVPMVAHGEVVGTLGVVRTESDLPYDEADAVTLQSLADRAALAIADARGPRSPLGATDFEAIFLHSIDGVLFTVPDGTVLAANPAACEILQRTEAEICALGRAGLLVGDDPRTVAAVEQRARTGRVRAEVPMIRGDGSVFLADLASTIFDADGGELRACVIFRDVSEQARLREAVEEQARTFSRLADEDELTGVRNRRGFAAAAEQALAFADREEVPVQLAFVDLDRLKWLNDTYGHRVGDAAIVCLADAIRDAARDVDVVGRIGGDELVVLLWGASPDVVEGFPARVAELVEARRGDLPPISFTVGVAERRPHDPRDLDALLHEADQQMYARKLRRRVLGD